MVQPRSIKRKLQGWVAAIFVLTGMAGWAGIWGLFYISNNAAAVGETQFRRAREAGVVQTAIVAARRLDRDLIFATAATAVSQASVRETEARELAAREAAAREAAQRELAEKAEAARNHGKREPIAAAAPAPTPAVAATAPVAALALDDTRKAQAAQLLDAWNTVGSAIAQARKGGAEASAIAALTNAHENASAAAKALVDAALAGSSLAELKTGVLATYDAKAADLERLAAATTADAFAAVESQSERTFSWIWVLQIVLFVTVGASQAFSAWAGWQLSRSLAAQLTGLKDSAEKISLGDFSTAVNIASADTEIVEVGAALDRLRVSLGKAMERLNARRTQPPPARTEG